MNRRDMFKGLAAATVALIAPIADASERIDVARNVWWSTTKPDIMVVDAGVKAMFDEAFGVAITDSDEQGNVLVQIGPSINGTV